MLNIIILPWHGSFINKILREIRSNDVRILNLNIILRPYHSYITIEHVHIICWIVSFYKIEYKIEYGYIDIGKGVDGEQIRQAENVLVIMVVV